MRWTQLRPLFQPADRSRQDRALKRVIRMQHSLPESNPRTSNIQLLLAYVADLELEVDRLRKQGQFVQHEVLGALKYQYSPSNGITWLTGLPKGNRGLRGT